MRFGYRGDWISEVRISRVRISEVQIIEGSDK